MTTPDLTAPAVLNPPIDAPPAAEPQDEPAPPSPPTAPAPDEAEERRRRRKLLLLAILGGLLIVVISFFAWYLLFRKPISELLPPPSTFVGPSYSYAFEGVNHPNGIAVSGDGSRIYVTQSMGTQEALVLDSSGTRLKALAPTADINPRPTQIYVAVNPTNGDVYTTDRVAQAVYVYAADGTFKQVFQLKSAIPGWQPLGIGFDKTGNVYVTDVGGAFHVVHEFAPDGTLVRDFGQAGTFDFPNGVVVDDAGNVYVADSNHGRLVVFGTDGTQRAAVERGENAGELGIPRGLAIDDKGRVYVVDASANRVEVYAVIKADATTLDFLGEFGTPGASDGQFQYPNGGAMDARGRLYVADWANNRVQIWSY